MASFSSKTLYTGACILICIYIYISYTYICKYIYTHTCICIDMYIYTYIYTYMYVCVCVVLAVDGADVNKHHTYAQHIYMHIPRYIYRGKCWKLPQLFLVLIRLLLSTNPRQLSKRLFAREGKISQKSAL